MMLSFCVHVFNREIQIGSQLSDSEVMLLNGVEFVA